MVEVSPIKLPSWIAFKLMSLELTENTSKIGSGALNDLVFILYCRVKPLSHMYCNLSATALRLNTAATNATTVRSKLHFFGCRSIGDWSATTIPKSRRPVEERSATGWRLIAKWFEMGCDWSATGWRQVGDGLATDYRSNNLLCRCNHE